MNTLEVVLSENVGLIWNIAKSFYGIDKNDLYQAGVLGVIKAFQNYSSDAKCKFSTYAYKYIYGEMYLLACNKDIKYGKDLLKLVKLIERGKNMLALELMRDPSIKELAEFLGQDEAKIELALQSVNSIVSLDNNEDDSRSLHETIAVQDNISEDDRILLNDGIKTLKPLEKDIINARYFEDLTQSETAKKLGITQVMVSRYETRSLEKMRNYMYM